MIENVGVYKFGGASIASPERITNVKNIISNANYTKLVVVISAMGKVTNALEEVWRHREKETRTASLLNDIRNNHIEVVKKLSCESAHLISKLDEITDLGNVHLSDDQHASYDQIVSKGELMSTSIVSEYLKKQGLNATWIDARSIIKTDSTFRAGNVDWVQTKSAIREKCNQAFLQSDIIITQGFIGSDNERNTTTLGREGSDFSAAILAHCLNAVELSIWKDVKGILTADPRKFDNVVKLDRLSYKESIEMTYYGAKVIHPKTIKPLENKGIPLLVKSFIEPDGPGTTISSGMELAYPPIVVVEQDQALLHFSAKDFSFIGEGHLGRLFQALDRHRLKVNLMKNSAKSFTVCVTNSDDRIEKLSSELSNEYEITVDPNLELLTIRHPNEEIISSLKNQKVILMEERAPKTVQIVVKDAPLMVRKA